MRDANVSIVEASEGAFLSITWPDAAPMMIPLSEERLAALAADASHCLRHMIQMAIAARAARESAARKMLESDRTF